MKRNIESDLSIESKDPYSHPYLEGHIIHIIVAAEER